MNKLILTMLALALLLGACVPYEQAGPTTPMPTVPVKQGTALSGELKTFDSIEEVQKYLDEQQVSSMAVGGIAADTGMMMAERSMASAPTAAPMAKMDGAEDFSSTNVQVAGVDEADFVKNDGRYVYMVHEGEVLIVDAYAGKEARIVSKIKISEGTTYYQDQPREIFIDGDTLGVIVQSYDSSFTFERWDIDPRQRQRPMTKVLTYDVSDREHPHKKGEVTLTGSYFQSRMIDGIVYLVAQESVNDGFGVVQPLLSSSRQGELMPKIHYFDEPEQSYQFDTIASIRLADSSTIDAQTFMLGYGATLMVSEDNMYIAYQQQPQWWRDGSRYERERFTDVILPLLPEEVSKDIRPILSQGLEEKEEWRRISKVLASWFEDISKKVEKDETVTDRYDQLFADISDAVQEYDVKKELAQRKTVIHKIGIDQGKLSYVAKGEVDGRLLNQFSLDEQDGFLRVATTVDVWAHQRVTYNDVIVLDGQLKQVGQVEDIAPGETVYAARFFGDRLYLVTYRQVDPFFVVDLSQPTNPRILGELKISGYSQYLHPLGADHVIGIGRETKQLDKGGVQTEGIKVALFDVSDVSDPVQKDVVVIGDQGSYSEVLNDHKAFLLDEKRGLMVLPVSEVTRREQKNQYTWQNEIWNGAYVFDVSEDGLSVKGKVRHSQQKSDYFTWRTQATVRRGLYLDDLLVTISDRFVKINDLGKDLEDVASITLPKAEPTPPPRPYPGPMYGGGIVGGPRVMTAVAEPGAAVAAASAPEMVK